MSSNPERLRAQRDREAKSRAKRRESINEKARDKYRQDRILCLNRYGNKCVCCGETRYEFLAIDHSNGGGNQHRKRVVGTRLVYWLIKNNFPDGFRVLCHNCNLALGFYGYCPHSQQTRS